MVTEALLSAAMIACLQTETPAMAVVTGEKDVRAKEIRTKIAIFAYDTKSDHS